MRLIYSYIKQFRNIENQEIYFTHDFTVTYNPEKAFPDALLITPAQASSVSAAVHEDSMLSKVHVIVGKTGAGKTNIFQLIGMNEDERIDNEENWGSYFLLYAWKRGFLIELFNIPVSEEISPKHPQPDDPAVARFPAYIKERSRLRESMLMFSFYLDENGKPMDIKSESEESLGAERTFIFNGFDRNAFPNCPYPEDKESFYRNPNNWQDREPAEFNRTALLFSCRHLKEYIEHFSDKSIKRKAALVIRNDNWAKTIKQHIDDDLEKHDYWTFTLRDSSDAEEYVIKGIRRKRKFVSIKNRFVHDLWTDYALYLRKWISYIEMYPEVEYEDPFGKTEAVKPILPMPNLPVARVMWWAMPDLLTGVECWITAGGAHHTVLSYDVTAEMMRDWAKMMDIEFVHITRDTTPEKLEDELMVRDLLWKLK